MLTLLTLPALPAAAQMPAYAPRESVTVIPGAQYRAGGLHRAFFGTRYRALWTTPIRVPLLDLKQFAGGLKPVRKGGGQQTHSLRLQGADGRLYQFRSVSKDPRAVLPPELRDTWAAGILQDQMSSAHPAGPAVVPPLLAAGGVLHTDPLLVQMPDDPALGEFRAEFAGLLGFIEVRPTTLAEEESNIGGASKIVSTADLFKQLDDEPAVRVDDRAFLRARLMDVFMGDWDRHDTQWRWALVDSGGPARWMPIPLDRDQVFVRFDGFLLWQARRTVPQLLNFGPEYGEIIGATWNGRDLDRRLLTGLERSVWDSTAAALKAKLTDAAIADAVAHLPPEFRPLDASRLEHALKVRRDHLGEMKDKYYTLLAHQVDIYATDKADEARVVREGDGTTLVTVAYKGQEYFQRRFTPRETQEVRIFLQGGDDHLSVEGPGRGSPLVRVIGGGGDDQFSVSRSSGIHLYDDRGQNQAQGAGINRKPWRWKPDSLKPDELPPRDWGNNTFALLSASYGYDVQAVVGYGGHTEWYGFRRVPYSTRLDYKLEVATGKLPGGRVTLGLTRQFENSKGFYALEGAGSNIEVLRWYGFGNETVANPVVAFNRVNANQLSGGIKLGFRWGKLNRNEVSVGPLVRWSNTNLEEKHNAVRFIGVDRPYGVGRFGMVGLRGKLTLEGRDHPHFASKGGSLSLQAAGYPAVWDAEEGVGRIEAEGSFALAPGGKWRPSLNFMAGGVKTWGKLPYFIAPTLGGIHTLRGYRPDRFAGDASLYGSAELRLPLFRAKFILPGEQGVFGFVDGGRVYFRGKSSDTWHSSVGGGVWFSFLTRDNVLYAGVGAPSKGKEGARLVLGIGFPY
jgi:hypothetical protein